MATPLEIVAATVHAAQCGCGTVEQPARDVAQVAVNALADERIVENAARALFAAGWTPTVRTPRPSAVVLRSVAEA